MSMYNDIDWTKEKKTSKSVFRIPWKLRIAHIDSRSDIGQSSDREQKKGGMERTPTSPKVGGTSLQK